MLYLFIQGIFYQGERDLDSLMAFIVNHINSPINYLTYENFIHFAQDKPVLVEFCTEDEGYCLSFADR